MLCRRRLQCLVLQCVDNSLFIRLCSYTQLGKTRRHALTHFSRARGTPSSSESLGLVQPRPDCLLWLSRDAAPVALLPAATTLREKTDSLPGRRKPDQPAPPSAFRERTRC